MNVPPCDAVRAPVDELRALSVSLLQAAGVPRADASLITELLLDTDLRGVLSHGTRTIANYVRAFQDGDLNPTPSIRVVRDERTTAVVDGDGGLGHPAAVRATDLAIAKAKASGLGSAISRHHGHFGGAGKYTRMAVRQDCVGFCVSGHLMEGIPQDTGQWNPLGCPPMSFAFPAGEEPPMILDMGTSFFGQDHFQSLFPSFPAPFFKSLGLVAVANLLGGVLAGMMAPNFRKPNLRYRAAWYGAFICAIDIDRFVPLESFKAEVDRTMREIHELPPLPGYSRYDLPGGLERDRERLWAVEGIPLGPEHRQELEGVADELGVSVPWR